MFFGTPSFGVPLLEALSGREDVYVAAVVTRPDRGAGRGQRSTSPPIAEAARDRGLPVHQPEDLAGEGPDLLEDAAPLDLGILAAYGEILPPSVFELPRHGVFNFHASLLPRWRGASPIRHALLHGDAETGITVFRVVAALDAGPISHRRLIPIGDRTTYGELFERLKRLTVEPLGELIEDLKADRLQLEPQEGTATYAPRLESEDARIDWSRSAEHIDRHVRAFCPVPGAFTFHGNDRLKLFDVRPVSGTAEGPPGTLLEVEVDRFRVRAGRGAVDVREVQPAGSRRMSVRDYLAGNPGLGAGDRLIDEPAGARE